MKKYTSAAIIAALGLLTLALLIPHQAKSTEVEAAQIVPTDLQKRQAVWMDALRWCESRGNDEAVNKVDRDGTASYGRFQFKPGTYASFAARYKLASTTNFMDGEEQSEIVLRMINDSTISDQELRTRQFPDCIQRKVGLPPRS